MSRTVLQFGAAGVFGAAAVAIAWRLRLGLQRELAVAAVRAVVQLVAVGAVVGAIFSVPALAVAFLAAMLATAAVTAASRLRGLSGGRLRAALAIGAPSFGALGLLLAVGALPVTARSVIPTGGILLGGAMAAAGLTGRRLLEGLRDDAGRIEAMLCLGDTARTALAPTIRTAVATGVQPVIDQTRSVGLVTLPGTFVGLVLGGASPATAARVQLLVLLSLLAVELLAAMLLALLVVRTIVDDGERVHVP